MRFFVTIAIAPEIERPYTFLGGFLTQIPGRLPEVTKQFVRYEAAHPASRRRIPAACEGAQCTIDRARDRPQTARESDLDRGGATPRRTSNSAVVLDRIRHYADAARELERAAELDPADPATHYRLSRVYDRLGKADDARGKSANCTLNWSRAARSR